MEPEPSGRASGASLRRVFTTDGRASRGFFWATLGVCYGCAALLGLAGEHLPEGGKLTIGLLAIPVIFAPLFVQIQRLHDRDKSGWWVLLNAVPCVGLLWALIECGCLPGTPGPNRYGPAPAAPPPVSPSA
jgi:uncharacterized membrane protein YhaH (DUF805 family)